jgi:hypothetical protein
VLCPQESFITHHQPIFYQPNQKMSETEGGDYKPKNIMVTGGAGKLGWSLSMSLLVCASLRSSVFGFVLPDCLSGSRRRRTA